jgi:hypothetical protein
VEPAAASTKDKGWAKLKRKKAAEAERGRAAAAEATEALSTAVAVCLAPPMPPCRPLVSPSLSLPPCVSLTVSLTGSLQADPAPVPSSSSASASVAVEAGAVSQLRARGTELKHIADAARDAEEPSARPYLAAALVFMRVAALQESSSEVRSYSDD